MTTVPGMVSGREHVGTGMRVFMASMTGGSILAFTLGVAGALISGPVGWAAVAAYGGVVFGGIGAVASVHELAGVNDSKCITPDPRRD